jgi:glycosyltransferase involved in cell wall biosynthesis
LESGAPVTLRANGDKLRIVHLDTGEELRGGQRQLLLLARNLRERGHEQLIVCPEESPLAERALSEGFRVFPLPQRDPGHLHGICDLRGEVQAGHFDILHAHDGRSQTVSALASLGLPAQRLATRRVTFMPTGLAGALQLHRLQYGRTCDAIIAVSAFVRDLLVRSGLDAAKIEIIPDGVEIPPQLPDAACRARARRGWDLRPEEFVIGHAGAFTREKGQDLLLEAFMEAGASLPAPARLLLVGEGPLRDSISDLVRRTQGRALVLGSMEDLTPFFASLDLYVMPSRAEGLGSSALLAMAHGLPVVASRVGGLPEIVEDGASGWLVEPESPAALARALIRTASDPGRLRSFGLAGRERARAFSSATMVNRTEALYHRLVSAGRGSS